MSEAKELNVGDVIYGKSIYHGISQYVIDRVTVTQAIAGKTRFQRQYYDWINEIGGSRGYGSTIYKIETPELIEKYRRQNLISKLEHKEWSKLSTDSLVAIVEIIESETKN